MPVPIISVTCTYTVCSTLPHYGPGESVAVLGCYTSTYYFTCHMGQGMGRGRGRGRGQGSQPGTSRAQGSVYAITPQTELADQSVIQGIFLLFCLWARVLFDSSASHSFIVASCVNDLGLKVETLEKLLQMSSPLGARVRVD